MTITHPLLLAGVTLVSTLAATSVGAQTSLKIFTNHDQLIETTIGETLIPDLFPGVAYGTQYLVLAARSGEVVQCVSDLPQTQINGKRATFDQNRHMPPTPLSAVQRSRLQGELRGASLPSNVMILGGEALGYTRADYLVMEDPAGMPDGDASIAGGSGLTLAVDGVRGYCFTMPQVDAAPQAPACEIAEDDNVFAGRFETLPQGQLSIDVVAGFENPPMNTRVQYTYTLRAVGGPVFDIDLREQFPFHTDDDVQPTYGRSLNLVEVWQCQGSTGANCSSRQGREVIGVGVASLDGGSLAQAGACMTVTSKRDFRADGIHEDKPFSNRLHVGAVYRAAATPNGPGAVGVEAKRLPFTTGN